MWCRSSHDLPPQQSNEQKDSSRRGGVEARDRAGQPVRQQRAPTRTYALNYHAQDLLLGTFFSALNKVGVHSHDGAYPRLPWVPSPAITYPFTSKVTQRCPNVLHAGAEWTFGIEAPGRRDHRRMQCHELARSPQPPREVHVFEEIHPAETAELFKRPLACENRLILQVPANPTVALLCQPAGQSEPGGGGSRTASQTLRR